MEKLGSGIVSVTAALVAALGLIIYTSMMSGNPYAEAVPSTAERVPASLASVIRLAPQAETVAQKALHPETEVVTLNCFNGSTPLELKSHAKQIRLRGPVCGGYVFNQPEVINRTNGFVATLFETGRNNYSSDYIHLAVGTNQILISYTDASGDRRLAELTVLRQ